MELPSVPRKPDTQWHDLTLVTEGEEMRLSVDGSPVLQWKSAGFAPPVKRWFSLLSGSSVWIDYVKIWKVR